MITNWSQIMDIYFSGQVTLDWEKIFIPKSEKSHEVLRKEGVKTDRIRHLSVFGKKRTFHIQQILPADTQLGMVASLRLFYSRYTLYISSNSWLPLSKKYRKTWVRNGIKLNIWSRIKYQNRKLHYLKEVIPPVSTASSLTTGTRRR